MKEWIKNKNTDKIWWLDDNEVKGLWIFSFDKEKTFNMYEDYPEKLTEEEKSVFDKENPFWADYFRSRSDG